MSDPARQTFGRATLYRCYTIQVLHYLRKGVKVTAFGPQRFWSDEEKLAVVQAQSFTQMGHLWAKNDVTTLPAL